MKKLFGLMAVSSLLVILVSQPVAQAHVLFVDENTRIAAVFHSNPDDDPIAGQESELFFDIQDKDSEVRIPYSGYDLQITDEQGDETTVPIRAAGSTVIAKYNFPAQGLYKLSLKSQPEYDSFQKVTLSGSLRVNRGTGTVVSQNQNNWPVIGLVAGSTALVLLGITFINNRRAIIAKSRF